MSPPPRPAGPVSSAPAPACSSSPPAGSRCAAGSPRWLGGSSSRLAGPLASHQSRVGARARGVSLGARGCQDGSTRARCAHGWFTLSKNTEVGQQQPQPRARRRPSTAGPDSLRRSDPASRSARHVLTSVPANQVRYRGHNLHAGALLATKRPAFLPPKSLQMP